jgi:hypothetical protein
LESSLKAALGFMEDREPKDIADSFSKLNRQCDTGSVVVMRYSASWIPNESYTELDDAELALLRVTLRFGEVRDGKLFPVDGGPSSRLSSVKPTLPIQ